MNFKFSAKLNTCIYTKCYSKIQIVACQFLAVIILVVYNVYAVIQTMAVWQAVRGRNSDALAALLHLTQTERVSQLNLIHGE